MIHIEDFGQLLIDIKYFLLKNYQHLYLVYYITCQIFFLGFFLLFKKNKRDRKERIQYKKNRRE